MKTRFLHELKLLSLAAIAFLALVLGLNYTACGQTTLVYDDFGTSAQNPISRPGWTAITGGSSNWELRTDGTSTGYTGASGGANVYTTMSSKNKTKTLTYSAISTVGYDVVTLSFGALRSGSLNSLYVSYSTDGTNYTSWASVDLTTSWTLYYGDLPSGALNQSNLRIRFSIISNNSTTRFLRIDDFKISGTVCNTITSYPFAESFDVRLCSRLHAGHS